MIRVLEKLRSVTNGGIETFVFGISERLNDEDIKIEIYSDNKPESQKYEDIAKSCGIRLRGSGRDYKAVRIKPLRMLLKWVDFLKFIKQEHYDIIHLHMCRPYDILYAAAARLAGSRHIILHSHSSWRSDVSFPEKLADPFFRALSRKKGYHLAACSKQAAEYMFGDRSFVLLKNGIETDKFSYSPELRITERERLGIGDSFAVGNVGRLCEAKNQSFLLEIFAELLKLRQDSILIIAGDGELESRLKQKAEELKISEKVIFCGAVDNTSLLYQAMDCFVFPSNFEGLGIAAIEAQTAGLKTICSDGVPREAAVTELCSFMPLKASPKEWAEHIISECDGYVRRSYAKEVRTAGYDIADTAKQLEKIYRSLAEE
ncbi:MAG: glycosyltransferase [Oscillospiraceae bacterium]|nr:glycosyltransferase [Oscillospiraceae bacterium]